MKLKLKIKLAALVFIGALATTADGYAQSSDAWHLTHNASPAGTVRFWTQAGNGIRAQYVTLSDILAGNLTGNAATATALAANGSNCATNSAAGGVNASGAAESCIAPAILAGISGGQTLNGGTGSGESLTLSSTANATKGSIIFGNSRYDEVNNRLGLGVTPSYTLDISSSTASDFNVRIQNTSSSGFSGLVFLNNSGTAVSAIGNDNTNFRLRINSLQNQPISILANGTEHFRIDTAGHLNVMGTAPTASCTGVGSSPPAATVVGTDKAFIVTANTGTSPSSTGTCTVTFAVAYTTNAPILVCMLVDGASAWGAESVIRQSTESASAPVVSWANVAALALTNLTGSSSYKISCHVYGRL